MLSTLILRRCLFWFFMAIFVFDFNGESRFYHGTYAFTTDHYSTKIFYNTHSRHNQISASIPESRRRQQSSNSLAISCLSGCSNFSNRRKQQRLPNYLTTAQRNMMGSTTTTSLTTKANNENDGGAGNDDIQTRGKQNPFCRAYNKFKARPGTYLIIPCVAACVGWITNWMAVQMIFYPIKFRGIPLYIRPEVPLGLIGWQGIVPCKTRKMSETMVDMVTSQLLSVKDTFGKLDPNVIAKLLKPEVSIIATDVLGELVPKYLTGLSKSIFVTAPALVKAIVNQYSHQLVRDLTVGIQNNVDAVFNIKNCVIDQMLQDRAKLGQLFKKCGQKELDFLTNSGLWFGFMLGIIQMIVALFYDNPWTLSIGGCIVGYATNWLALKWIFEPINPTKIGPFILQGQFLRRQKEVSKEFSDFFANKILTSEKVWNSILTDPSTTPDFRNLFTKYFTRFVNQISMWVKPEQEMITLGTSMSLSKLPNHVHVLHPYIDKTLGLQESLRIKMEQMTPLQFERVLHPIFEEDELTLIIAGAVLGFAAGLLQQGLETGKIILPTFRDIVDKFIGKKGGHFEKRVVMDNGAAISIVSSETQQQEEPSRDNIHRRILEMRLLSIAVEQRDKKNTSILGDKRNYWRRRTRATLSRLRNLRVVVSKMKRKLIKIK